MKNLNFKNLVEKELKKARVKHKPQSSIHEGYAILLEEVDEFWDHVKAKSEKRNYKKTLNELVQIASSAQKTAEDIIFPQLRKKKR